MKKTFFLLSFMLLASACSNFQTASQHQYWASGENNGEKNRAKTWRVRANRKELIVQENSREVAYNVKAVKNEGKKIIFFTMEGHQLTLTSQRCEDPVTQQSLDYQAIFTSEKGKNSYGCAYREN